MKLPLSQSQRDSIFLVVLALIGYLPFLGAAPLFDWDEINFAESAREMLVSGNYFQVQINFEPFWEKPPLFIWMQVLSMKIFGVNAAAARLPNALLGIATLLSLYRIGNRFKGQLFARILAGFYFVSILPFLYFKSGIIDPTFNFFIFLGLIQIIRFEIDKSDTKSKYLPLWAGFWIGLATLTKGPVAVLVSGLVYVAYKLIWNRKEIPWLALSKFIAIYLAVILSWFGSIILFSKDGWEIVVKFIAYQAELASQAVAGHDQPFFYHFLVFLIGCFPLSAFAFRGMAMKNLEKEERLLRNFMLIWFWVVLILFSLVRTKIVHYSSLLYFPGAFLAAFYLEKLWKHEEKPKWDVLAIYFLGMLIFGGSTVSVNWIFSNQDWLISKATNSFMAACLNQTVEWPSYAFVVGFLFIIGSTIALFWLWKGKFKYFFITLLITTPIFLNGLNFLILPRIADYSQNAAIRFFESKAEEDAYVMVENYKSYAHYFYGKVKPFPHPEIPETERGAWMARGASDKPVYLVTRIDRATEEFEQVWFAEFDRIGSEGGFVFYKRELPK